MKTLTYAYIGHACNNSATLTDADWQALIDTVNEAPKLARACHGLALPENLPPGILADLAHKLHLSTIYMARVSELMESGDIGGKDSQEHLAMSEMVKEAGPLLALLKGIPVTVSPLDDTPDRRVVWSFRVDGQHVRWCGTLEQFDKDCAQYCDASQGRWENLGKRHRVFHDSTTKEKTVIRAVKA